MTQESNPGVKYEYLLPLSTPYSASSSEENNSIELETSSVANNRHALKSGSESLVLATTMPSAPRSSGTLVTNIKSNQKYVWKITGFTACNKSCGGGIQSPIIRCVREHAAPSKVKYFINKRCMHLPKPVINENIMRCNTQPCPAEWKIGDWSSCDCGQWDEKDYQTREIECVQELSPGLMVRVHNGACLEDMPEKRQVCKCNNSRRSEKYKHHKHRKHNHGERQSVTLVGNTTLTKRAHVHVADNKKSGIWLASDWNEQCSSECGDGIQYRSIFCDRSAPNTDRCDLRATPETTRQCTTINQCEAGDWFIGPWGQCTGDCFSLTRSRSIYCIKNGEVVEDAICIDTEDLEGTAKPITTENCSIADVPDCRPRWHISDWSEVIYV